MNARLGPARLLACTLLVLLLHGCAAAVGPTEDDAAPQPETPTEQPQAPEPDPRPAEPFEPSAPGEIVSDAVKTDRRFIVGDMRRANIATTVEQGPPGILRVGIGPGFHTQGSREFFFRRLASAYFTWVQEGQPLVIELWEGGAKIGEYTSGRFAIGPDYAAPRECPDTATTGLCSGTVIAAPQPPAVRPTPADTRQAPLEPARTVRERSGLHLGLGLGGGVADLACTGCDFASETGLSGFLAVGGAIGETLVVGVEGTGWTKSEASTSSQVYSLMAHVTRYLNPTSGLFLRGGLGLVGYREDRSSGDLTANALGFSSRLGYEIGSGKFVLTPFVGIVRTFAGADFKREGEDIGFNAAVSNLHAGLGIGMP